MNTMEPKTLNFFEGGFVYRVITLSAEPMDILIVFTKGDAEGLHCSVWRPKVGKVVGGCLAENYGRGELESFVENAKRILVPS